MEKWNCTMDGWCSHLTMVLTAISLCGLRAGINAVLFYAPVIFTALGASQQAALLSAVAVRLAGFQSRALPGHQCAYICLAARHHRRMQEDKSDSKRRTVLVLHHCAPSAL